MGCGCGSSKTAAPMYQWRGPDGQVVSGLTKSQAETRKQRKGGTVAQQ